ncbi:MAG: aspartate 1-decarboxylase [Armatimonadetes bacterium]|nr:aspartate 1-decarboxylase [Armatimonadota bacterium]
MLRIMCVSKIHGATVTRTELHYTGSITIPAELLRAAGMLPNERVQIVNLNNGSRIETYIIEGPEGSGDICLNGPAARTASVGDAIHILCYALLDEEEARSTPLNVVHVDENNRLAES